MLIAPVAYRIVIAFQLLSNTISSLVMIACRITPAASSGTNELTLHPILSGFLNNPHQNCGRCGLRRGSNLARRIQSKVKRADRNTGSNCHTFVHTA
jgi:hypothetical protein